MPPPTWNRKARGSRLNTRRESLGPKRPAARPKRRPFRKRGNDANSYWARRGRKPQARWNGRDGKLRANWKRNANWPSPRSPRSPDRWRAKLSGGTSRDSFRMVERRPGLGIGRRSGAPCALRQRDFIPPGEFSYLCVHLEKIRPAAGARLSPLAAPGSAGSDRRRVSGEKAGRGRGERLSSKAGRRRARDPVAASGVARRGRKRKEHLNQRR